MVTQETAIEMAKSFIKECNLNGLAFQKVLLFGSAASNTMHQWSDIDLLLISDQFGSNVFENLSLYAKINAKYPMIETHPYPAGRFNEGDAFLEKISKDSLEISC